MLKITPKLKDPENMEDLINDFLPYSKQRLGYIDDVDIELADDEANASNPLGYTAYYDPFNIKIVVFCTNRHPKDILRSLSHELVHHAQNCCGDFDDYKTYLQEGGEHEGYAQDNEHMREMERDAYERGNMIFRDWTDSLKKKKRITESYCERAGIPLNKNLLTEIK